MIVHTSNEGLTMKKLTIAALVCLLLVGLLLAVFVHAKTDSVMFAGDSITNFWSRTPEFSAHGWTNAGVNGRVCGKVEQRFLLNLIAHRPKTVHLLCGSNDAQLGSDIPSAERSIDRMVKQAQWMGAKVVLGAPPPVRFNMAISSMASDTNARIVQLDTWIRSYGAQNGIPVVDYYAVMKDSDGQIVLAYTKDGLHPSADGYRMMDAALSEILGR
jgi:lysophospholipase L1-like esterase